MRMKRINFTATKKDNPKGIPTMLATKILPLPSPLHFPLLSTLKKNGRIAIDSNDLLHASKVV